MTLKFKVASAALSFACFSANSFASDSCIPRSDVVALQVASVQQQLMVAALTCRDISRYNRFVVAYQPELRRSDAVLLSFFVHHDSINGTANYHTFKTKLANDASLRSAEESESFCRTANDAFEDAFEGRTLAAFVATQPVAFHMPGNACDDDALADAATASADRPVRHHRRHSHTTRISDAADDGNADRLEGRAPFEHVAMSAPDGIQPGQAVSDRRVEGATSWTPPETAVASRQDSDRPQYDDNPADDSPQ